MNNKESRQRGWESVLGCKIVIYEIIWGVKIVNGMSDVYGKIFYYIVVCFIDN